jgi:hypothetical protein
LLTSERNEFTFFVAPIFILHQLVSRAVWQLQKVAPYTGNYTKLQCYFTFWSFEIIDSPTLSVKDGVPFNPRICCTFHYRLNQTVSEIFMLFCCYLCFKGTPLFQITIQFTVFDEYHQKLFLKTPTFEVHDPKLFMMTRFVTWLFFYFLSNACYSSSCNFS